MVAQETYRIEETSSLVLREWSPTLRKFSDIAIVKSQGDRLIDLLYKDAERGYRYDTVAVKRYAVYLMPVGIQSPEGGKRIGEFARLDTAELVCAALNSYSSPIIKALEAEFGPVAYGPADIYADEDGKTNPYGSFCFAWKGEDTPEVRARLIKHLVADLRARRISGDPILRVEPSFSSQDGYVRLRARLTFAGGIDRTGDQEAKGPVFINSIKDHGAVGDGVTDDMRALQNSIVQVRDFGQPKI